MIQFGRFARRNEVFMFFLNASHAVCDLLGKISIANTHSIKLKYAILILYIIIMCFPIFGQIFTCRRK